MSIRSSLAITLYTLVILMCSWSANSTAEENLLNRVCSDLEDIYYCDLYYTYEFCNLDPSRDSLFQNLDCFVEARNSLNQDIVDCIQSAVTFAAEYQLSYYGANILAPYKIEYYVPSDDGDIFLRTGAVSQGEEFSSTFIELFTFDVDSLSIDGTTFLPPEGRILVGEALNSDFWAKFSVGISLSLDDGKSFSLSHLRDFFSLHWNAMENCFVDAPNIFVLE